MSTASLQKLMKEFFATHSYNREDDWRETPETDADPVDDGDVVRLKDWDPAQHPRVPAGSGDPSGQFTSGEGIGAEPTAVLSPDALQSHTGRVRLGLINGFAAERLLNAQRDDDVLRLGEHGYEAHRLLAWVAKEARSVDALPNTVNEFNLERGRVRSGIQYQFKEGHIKIHLLGSLEGGQGAKWVHEMERIASAAGIGIELESLPEARGFYKKMGFRVVRNPGYSLWEATKSANAVKASMEKKELGEDDSDVGVLALTKAFYAELYPQGGMKSKAVADTPLALNPSSLLDGPLEIETDYAKDPDAWERLFRG